MAHIDMFYTLLSPFTYMCANRVEEITAKHGATITYRPCDLQAVFAETGGVPVPKRSPARQAYRLQELPRLARRAGVPLNLHPKHWPVDATRSILCSIAAGQAGHPIWPVSFAFLRACWAEDRDISDPATIDAILNECGVGSAECLDLEAATAVYDDNTKMALANGVFGAPFFVVGEEKFWGQDRLEFLDEHLGSL